MNLLYFIAFFWCLFGFKFNIVSIGAAGLRVDDLLAVLLAFDCLNRFVKGSHVISKPVAAYLLFITLGLASCVASWLYSRTEVAVSLLYALRPLEYLVFIYLGYRLGRARFNLEPFYKGYIIYCLALIFLQSRGLIGGVTGFSFDRAIANTGGPWEMAAVAAFFMIYFLRKSLYVWSLLSFVILVLTQSRSTLVATLLAVLIFSRKDIFSYFRSNVRAGIFLLAIFVLPLGVLSYTAFAKADASGDVISRFSTFFEDETVNNVKRIVTQAPIIETQSQYVEYTYGDELSSLTAMDGDASAYVRFNRWATLIKSTLHSPSTIIFGLGPSFAGKAVDGYYVRLFAESGILGCLSFLVFQWVFFRHTEDRVLRAYVFALLLTACFIDIFVTYKAMMLLWLTYGYIRSLRDRAVGQTRSQPIKNQDSLPVGSH